MSDLIRRIAVGPSGIHIGGISLRASEVGVEHGSVRIRLSRSTILAVAHAEITALRADRDE